MSAQLRQRLIIATAAVLSLLLISFFIIRGSNAVFTDTTDNTGDTWAAGTVDLVNDPESDGTFGDATTAEFNEADLSPGDTGSGCIDVQYDGDPVGLDNVRFYQANLNDTDGGSDSGTAAQLSDDIDFEVAIHPAGEDCTTNSGTPTTVYNDTLANLSSGYAAGVDTTWSPTATGELRAFEFTWTLGADTADDAQGDSVSTDLLWEVRSN